MHFMRKRLTINENRYDITCEIIIEKKKIIIKVDEDTRYSSKDDIYKKSIIREYFLLELIGLTAARRLEWKMKKIIKFLEKRANKIDPLRDAIKHVDSIYNLDKHMDL